MSPETPPITTTPRPCPLLSDEELLDLRVLADASDLSRAFREHCRALVAKVEQQQAWLRHVPRAPG